MYKHLTGCQKPNSYRKLREVSHFREKMRDKNTEVVCTIKRDNYFYDKHFIKNYFIKILS